jgi:DNA-binding NarL/FixJ family response regulator
MPGMGGRELAARIDAGYPDTTVRFMSGYTNDEGIRHGLLGEGRVFVQKQLNMDEVLTTLRRLMNGGAETG